MWIQGGKVLLAMVCFCSFISGFAQGQLPVPTPLVMDANDGKTKNLYKKQNTKGIVLLTVGGLMIGGGITCFLELNPYSRAFYDKLRHTFGVFLLDAGAGQTILGAINIAKSRKTKQKFHETKPTVGFIPILTPEISDSGPVKNLRVGAAMRINF